MTHSAADRLDILELLASADNAATRRDVTSYIACFTDDAVLDGVMGEHRGKAAMEEAVGPIWQAEGETSVHLTTNAIVEADSGADDRAVAHSVLVILANDPVTVHSISNITHHLLKESTGWRVSRRTVQPCSELRRDRGMQPADSGRPPST
jgi:ketosteroid isomerase-like protein